jgi:hypothetical protein
MPRKPLHVGDKVEWISSGGRAVGRVEKKITRTTRVAGHVAKATEENPEYQVRSEKSGKRAIHKATALKRRAD